MALRKSGEDYLEAVYILRRKYGAVRSVDVARHLGVSKPSVCKALGILRDCGLLVMDGKGYLHLTEQGKEQAESIYERHRFFVNYLIAAGVDPETAERDGCRMEHAVSEEAFRKLKAYTEKETD